MKYTAASPEVTCRSSPMHWLSSNLMSMFLAGNPFLVRTDIAVSPCKKQIIIDDADTVHYGNEGGKTKYALCKEYASLPPAQSPKGLLFSQEITWSYTHLAKSTPIQCGLSNLGWTVVPTCGVSQS